VSYVINGVLPKWLNGRDDKMGTVQGLWQCASQYREHHAGFVLSSFCIVYIALQTFAIPGPIVLSILSGAMYPFLQAQLLVAFCATTGASLCFMLSYFLGRGVFSRLLAGMIGRFKEKVGRFATSIIEIGGHNADLCCLCYFLMSLDCPEPE
jgi:membrane protein YqaA with SNARE-associated domain